MGRPSEHIKTDCLGNYLWIQKSKETHGNGVTEFMTVNALKIRMQKGGMLSIVTDWFGTKKCAIGK